MKFPICTSTPGLDRYPERERFTVYRATHKQLMGEDAAYRRHWNSYVPGIVCVAITSGGGFVAGGPLGVALSVLMLAASAGGVVFLAFRQQKLMNQRIGDALKRQAA